MLEGWNNETILHENRFYYPKEKKNVLVFPSNMAAMKTLYNSYTVTVNSIELVKFISKPLELSMELTEMGVKQIPPV